MKITADIYRVLNPAPSSMMGGIGSSPASSHFVVRVFTSQWTWQTSWAPDEHDDGPSEREVIAAWREDTNSGRRKSKNWERT